MNHKRFWDALRIAQVITALSLITSFVLRPNAITIVAAAMYLGSLVFGFMAHRRDDAGDERSRRICLRGAADGFIVLMFLAGLSVLGIRYIPKWPTGQDLVLLFVGAGIFAQNLSECWYRLKW